MNHRNEALVILHRILARIQKPNWFRAMCIGFLFPEMDGILEDLAKLSTIIEDEQD